MSTRHRPAATGTLPQAPAHQRGNVALIVALSAAALFGFAGIALDVGRLFVNKTELQTAADACALAAAAELTCDPVAGACPASFLQNAEAAGIYAAGRNKRDLQSNGAVIAADDVKFSTVLAPNSTYFSRGAGASTNSRYAMCTAQSTGLIPWFMMLLGAGEQTVVASGVATRAPAQTSCPNAPIGICQKAVGTYAVGEWIESTFQTNGNNDDALDGGFKWVEYTATSNIRAQLAGSQTVCGVRVGDTITTQGTHQGSKSAYNTRFGIYPNGANAYTAATAPPDHTGYSYPNKSPGSPVISVGSSAYADYRSRQASSTPFTDNEYGVSGAGGNIAGNPSGTATHQQAGTERRLITAPVIDCDTGNSTTITAMACVLMLNPMSNGATGTIYLEYRGLTTDVGSPCRTGGTPGGPGSAGVQVPTLVQ